MVNNCTKRCYGKNVFAGKRKFSLNKAKKEKKKLFCRKSGSMPTFRSTRKGKKCVFVTSLRLSDHKVVITQHRILINFFFDFARIFSLVFRTSNFWSLRNLIKTIIPFALVEHETGYSQLGATRHVGYLPSHIQRGLME